MFDELIWDNAQFFYIEETIHVISQSTPLGEFGVKVANKLWEIMKQVME